MRRVGLRSRTSGVGPVRALAIVSTCAILAPGPTVARSDQDPAGTSAGDASEVGKLRVQPRPSDGAGDILGNGYRSDVLRTEQSRCFRVKTRSAELPVCVHWVTKSGDAPPRLDQDRDGRPDWVDKSMHVLRKVAHTEIDELGYEPPLLDAGRPAHQGENAGLDIYLADVGRTGLGGYCSRDLPAPTEPPGLGERDQTDSLTPQPQHVYCVIDDDFSRRQFPAPAASGVRGLKVVAAHEFFHAIESAYSTGGDDWLREGAATWMESEVFPGIKANQRLLADSPLGQHEIPLDASNRADDGDSSEYGAWVFWKFLSELYGDSSVVRSVWESLRQDPNESVSDAVLSAVAGRAPVERRCFVQCSTSPGFGDLMLEFARWNLEFKTAYQDGASYRENLRCSIFPDAAFSLSQPADSADVAGSLTVSDLSARILAINASSEGAGGRFVVDGMGADLRAAAFEVTSTSAGLCAEALGRVDRGSEDGRTISFSIRPGLQFIVIANGGAGSAEDHIVNYSVEPGL